MNPSLYEQDFLLWVEETATRLKKRDLAQLDWEHLIEEVESLGTSQRYALRSLLRRLWEHLLKRRYVPSPETYVGWEREIRNVRNEIQDLLENSPSLRQVMAELIRPVYTKALATVRQEYPQVVFPDGWPEAGDVESLLNVDFWDKA